MKRRRKQDDGTRPRGKATMARVLDLKPDEQAALGRGGDPFPPKPDWTDAELAALNDQPVPFGGEFRVRQPMFTPAEEAAAQYVGRFTQRIWALARQGQFGEARRLAAQWAADAGHPQHRPVPGSHPYRDTGPQPAVTGRDSGPQPAVRAVSLLPQMPRHRPLPPMALEPVRSRRATVARNRLSRIPDLPLYDGYGHEEEFAAYMRSVGLATGTHTELEHAGAWQKRYADAGPVPVSRGLAITAGLPRRRAAAGTPGAGTAGRHAAAGPPARPETREPAVIDRGMLERVRDRLRNLPELPELPERRSA